MAAEEATAITDEDGFFAFSSASSASSEAIFFFASSNSALEAEGEQALRENKTAAIAELVIVFIVVSQVIIKYEIFG